MVWLVQRTGWTSDGVCAGAVFYAGARQDLSREH
jgi:hypothetical protein